MMSQRPIDNVTVELLEISLRLIGVKIEKPLIDKIIDIVELIEEKGGDVNIKDIAKLESDWNFNFKDNQ
jgi:hypothetical protein